MNEILKNRTEAGQKLSQRLLKYRDHPNGLVLALPRGGVPVAFEISKQLHLPLDLCLVRKLGVPERPELAMGAIALNGVRVLNHQVIRWLDISDEIIDQVVQKEQKELDRRNLRYRGNTPFPEISDRTIILVDDGIATGSTLKAAITALNRQKPQSIVVAVPVAPSEVCTEIEFDVTEMICLLQPDPLNSISLWYENFNQTSDEEVCQLLAQANPSLVNI